MAKGALNRAADIDGLTAGDVATMTDSEVLVACKHLGVKALDAGGQARAALRERLHAGTSTWEAGRTKCKHCGSVLKSLGISTDSDGRRYRRVRCSGHRRHEYRLYEAER